MNEQLERVFKNFKQKNINYCLMRDYDELDQLSDERDVDLLLKESQLTQLNDLLVQFGFANLTTPGFAPHHFYVAYDEDTDCWLKLDIVTEVAFGRPVHAMRTDLADGCLCNRRYREPIFILSAEDELVTLLLHCVLDKGEFRAARRQRLQKLCREVADLSYLATLLVEYWAPAVTWPQLAEEITIGNWTALLSQGKIVANRLACWDRLGTLSRRISGRVLRLLHRLDSTLRTRALMVALLAPDGAGKTTLAAGIQKTFYFPTRVVYMGPYQQGTARPAHLPVPGLVLIGRLFRQWLRYLAARYHQARGRLVIFDRYSYDALLPLGQPLPWLTRGHCRLLGDAIPSPDMVLVLDAPGQVLYARKGEHSAAILEQQRQGYLRLQTRLRQAVVVEATNDTDFVRRKVTAIIWRRYASVRINFAY